MKSSRICQPLHLAIVLGLLVGYVATNASADQDPQPSGSVEIVRTAFHIPHITASNFRDLGYGIGYAYAQDNVCLLAEMLITVRGNRSRYFGGGAKASWGDASNLESDIFYRSYLDREVVGALYRHVSGDAAELVAGYAAGYNRYLTDTDPAMLPAACKNAAWVTPASPDDIKLLMADKMIEGSMAGLKTALAAATPPTGSADERRRSDASDDKSASAPPGSNGYALGRDLVAGGTGLLVANPHFPWNGPNRFYEMHLTIPDKLDVMGATILPFPAIVIGFNKDVAWTHTVSTGQRKTIYELSLDPHDPKAYFFDGRIETMKVKTVKIDDLLPDGVIKSVSHTTYWTRFGPVITGKGSQLEWDEKHAYAVRDAMLDNTRALDQWLQIDQSASVNDIRRSLVKWQGTPWVNTLAADKQGDTLYADLSVVPNVSEAMISSCEPSGAAKVLAKEAGLILLDGSRSACDWRQDAAQTQSGIIPPGQMPAIERRDFVLNSNNSFWLANADQPLTGYPSVVGKADEPQNLRTRMGYLQLQDLVRSKKGAISSDDLEKLLMSDRNYAAETALDDIIDICGSDPDYSSPIQEGCQALRAWDRRDDTGSKGAVMFRELWYRILELPMDELWQKKFDSAHPLTTPTELAKAKPTVRRAILQAIEQTVLQIRVAGFPADVALGMVQTRATANGKIALPGGTGEEGVLNLIAVGELGKQGYPSEGIGGSSYIQIVTWDEHGPVARGLLTYSQSSNLDSPFFSDQTEAFSAKRLYLMPFARDSIERQAISTLELRTDR